MGRGLGPGLGGIHRLALSRDDVGVERILDVGRRIGLAPQTLRIALVFGEQQLRGAIAMEPVLAQLMVRGLDGARPRLAQRRLRLDPSPHDQVLRNHSVGKTRSRAASGPRLCTVMRMSTSSGPSLAYSTNTSK